MGAVTDFGMKAEVDAGVDTGAEADSMFFVGEAVADLSSAFFWDFFFSGLLQSNCLPIFFWGGLGMIRLLFRYFSFAVDGGSGN